MYQLHNMYSNERVRLKIYLPERQSCRTHTYYNFFCRRQLDGTRRLTISYGVIFEGHPNLKRILNVEDMVIFPDAERISRSKIKPARTRVMKCLDDKWSNNGQILHHRY